MRVPDPFAYFSELAFELRPGAKFELLHMERLLARMGHPERRFRSIHIAGTNGKGSTAATLEAIYRHSGVRTGLFTSPHLETITERIRLLGVDISAEQFSSAFVPVYSAIQDLLQTRELPHPPSYFETVTAVAFQAFADAGIELAVVEVGLGGRLDATNVLEPLLSIITPIGFDHQQYLGTTLSAIAGEKAGIIKPGIPVLTAWQAPEALAVLHRRAHMTGVTLQFAPETSNLHLEDDGTFRFDVSYRGAMLPVRPLLPGRHQVENTRLAIAACEVLGDVFPVSPQQLQPGLDAIRWPGRLERFVLDKQVIWLDGAHNEMGAAALASFMESFFKQTKPVLLFGSMSDKDVEAIAAMLFSHAAAVVLTSVEHPRAVPVEQLRARLADWQDKLSLLTAPSLDKAMKTALKLAEEQSAPLVVTGSLYLAGAVRHRLVEGQAAQS